MSDTQMRALRAAALLVALGGLAACDTPPPASYVPVTVNVLDAHRRPVPGAAVQVADELVGRTGGSGRVVFGRLGHEGQRWPVSVALPPGFQPAGRAQRIIEHRLGEAAVNGRVQPMAVDLTFEAVDARREVLVHAALDCAALDDPATCADVQIRADGRVLGRLNDEGELWAVHRVVLNEPVEIGWVPGPGLSNAIDHPVARFTPTAGGDILVMRRSPGSARPTAAATDGPPPPAAVTPPAPDAKTLTSAGPRTTPRRARRGAAAQPPRARTTPAPRIPRANIPPRSSGPTTSRSTPKPPLPDSSDRATRSKTAPSEASPVRPRDKCIDRAFAGRGLNSTCRGRLESVEAGDPAYKKARKALFLAAVRGKRWTRVLHHADILAAVGSLRNDPELHYHRGVALSRLRRYAEAIVSLGRADQLKRHWDARLRGRRTLETLSRLAFAHDRLRRAGGARAGHHRRKTIDAWKRIAILARERGDEARAREAEVTLARLEAP